MSEPLIYVDRSDVREGALEELGSAIADLSAFVEENVPRILSYAVFFSDEGTQMTVVHVHSDPSSLDEHLRIAAPRFRRFAGLLTLRSIDVYGAPSAWAVRQLESKIELLGSGRMTLHPLHAGFVRSEP